MSLSQRYELSYNVHVMDWLSTSYQLVAFASAIVPLLPSCLKPMAVPTDGCQVVSVCLQLAVKLDWYDVVNGLGVWLATVLADIVITLEYLLAQRLPLPGLVEVILC